MPIDIGPLPSFMTQDQLDDAIKQIEVPSLYELKQLLKVLKRLKRSIVWNPWSPYRHHGICHVVNKYATINVRSLFTTWPESSGNPIYPVPSYDSDDDPTGAYDEACNKWIGEYGAARMRLLNHCIREVEEMIKKEG